MFHHSQILFSKTLYNLDEDFVVHSFVGVGVATTAGTGSSSGVGKRLFVANILPLKLLRIFSLALISNHVLFKNNIFSEGDLPLPIFLNSSTN